MLHNRADYENEVMVAQFYFTLSLGLDFTVKFELNLNIFTSSTQIPDSDPLTVRLMHQFTNKRMLALEKPV